MIGSIIASVIVIVVIAFTVVQVQKKVAAVAAKKAEEEARIEAEEEARKKAEEEAKRIEEYTENLKLVAMAMLSGASDMESCGDLLIRVWYNAIYKVNDDATDKYTRPDGYFVSDFNDAVQNLYSDPAFKKRLKELEDNYGTIVALREKLENPPEEYKDAYDAMDDLYFEYMVFVNLVNSPSGNLNTYTTNVDNTVDFF